MSDDPNGVEHVPKRQRADGTTAGTRQFTEILVKDDIPINVPDGGVAIDGSKLEGGGQLARVAMALSAVTGTSILVNNIRAGRSSPGLKNQHLGSLLLVKRICSAQVGGAYLGSSAFAMRPGTPRCGSYAGSTESAGSCVLLSQVALPCLLLAKWADGELGHTSELLLQGGTDATTAPPVDYLQHVLLPVLRQHFGITASIRVTSRGFYPKGGGSALLRLEALPRGQHLPPIKLTQQGNVTKITIWTYTSGLPVRLCERMANAAKAEAETVLGAAIHIDIRPVDNTSGTAVGKGAGMLIVIYTDQGCQLGASSMNQKGLSAENNGAGTMRALLGELQTGACVDHWLQDQLIIYMALAAGESVLRCSQPTMHTRAAMYVAEKMTSARFTLDKEHEAPGRIRWTIRCNGAGISARGREGACP